MERVLEDEADVLIVGTGAGGAPLAKELSEAGLEVLLLEEGKRHDPALLQAPIPTRIQRMYRNGGGYPALGRPTFPILVGSGVGGSTTVSNGTCFRAPAEVLRQWHIQGGIASLGPEAMNPHFERVEETLQIRPVPDALRGRSGRLLEGAAAALGYHGHVIRRYAPRCAGSGVCCFGCPTGAKGSMDVSYVPMALSLGARLQSEARVDEVMVEGGRAVGVRGHLVGGPERGRSFRARARVVVLSCGALFTPLLLARSGLSGPSAELGKNLRVQPCVKLMARMEDEVLPWEGVPQCYAVDHFRDQGFMIESIQVPAAVGASSFSATGERHRALMHDYRFMASLVAIVRDETSGRVFGGPGGDPIVRYAMSESELGRIKKGVVRMAELMFEAGAREIYLPTLSLRPISRNEGLAQVRTAALSLGELSVVSYHPMGTCRMGADPRTSVVGPHQEMHHVRGLFVADASVLPTALGVNPQLTIMALSTRLAGHLLDERARYFGRGAA